MFAKFIFVHPEKARNLSYFKTSILADIKTRLCRKLKNIQVKGNDDEKLRHASEKPWRRKVVGNTSAKKITE